MTTYTATAPNGLVISKSGKATFTHASFLVANNGETVFVGFAKSANAADNTAATQIRDYSRYALTASPDQQPRFKALAEKWTNYVVVEVEVAR